MFFGYNAIFLSQTVIILNSVLLTSWIQNFAFEIPLFSKHLSN